MKALNKVITALFLVIPMHAALAQDGAENQVVVKPQEKLSIAPMVGGTGFSISGSGMQSRGGSYFGVETLIPTGVDNLIFMTGLQLMQTGAKNEYFFASEEYEINSLIVPAVAQWTFYENPNTARKFYLRGGVAITQVVGAKARAQALGQVEEKDIKGEIASNDLMAIVGIGGSTKLFDDLRISFDLGWGQGTVNTIKGQSGKSSGLFASTALIVPL